ncbi:trifunctional serine/threonine-protein kinase/ATP-binding protein/sensor histidine kinase [Baaleninema sp.]|uniref:trifunctional serine/threonine-protein kinase/ATP-binding protein/sensor histidine kinase n=1 Tax=Baaleninema sp. TaxID=3101197 RepID=UPI003D0770F8
MFPEYEIVDRIYESPHSLVSRGVRRHDRQPVVLKQLKQDFPTARELLRYKQEYEITRSLCLSGVVRAYDLIPYKNTLIIVFEDIGAVSLKTFLETHHLSLKLRLEIGLKIVNSLAEVHREKIVHKDINPANIIYNRETGQLKIIDFGISSRATIENPALASPEGLEGTLAYMSPEQTGRTNRPVDYRTDFYSLGATLYELFAGRPPFVKQDDLELVHCHLAKPPTPLSYLNPDLPEPLDAIVCKLLAKSPEDRYQSPQGIAADLETCWRQWRQRGTVKPFPLGRQDAPETFQIPQKLYGREAELHSLLAAFDRVAAGSRELMLVSGYSGVGKSSLVAELQKPVTAKRGYFVTGKFDQLQRNVPYSALTVALTALVRQLLTESPRQLQRWTQKIRDTLGANVRFVVDAIPELEAIVGEPPPLGDLDPTEAQNRFRLAFQKFVRVFCRKEHPLVLFLDDLQWADRATLKLIESIVTDEDDRYLLVVGAYRDNEVNGSHALAVTLAEIEDRGAIVNWIAVHPLTEEQVARLIGDTLQRPVLEVRPLARLVCRKTRGNPFFIHQFLQALYREKLLVFDVYCRQWQWNLDRIEERDITDNVVELTLSNVRFLPPAAQQLLQVAACIGNRFDLKTLSFLAEQSPLDTYRDLGDAISAGPIVQVAAAESIGDTSLVDRAEAFQFKFLHDRIQQAAMSQVEAERQKQLNLRLGRMLYESLSPAEREDRIFELVDRFNVALDLIDDPAERRRLAEFNGEAGDRALEATAYAAACQYLRTGIACIPPQSWECDYELMLKLYGQLAQAEYLNGDFQASIALIDRVLDRVRSPLDKARIQTVAIVQNTLQGQYDRAIEVGREALSWLGIDLPQDHFDAALAAEVERVQAHLQHRDVADIVRDGEISDETIRVALRLLDKLLPPTYITDRQLMTVVAAQLTNLSLEYGLAAESSAGFAFYGILLATEFQDYRLAYEFGRLAMGTADRFGNLAYQCKAYHVYYSCIHHWVKPIRSSQAIGDAGYQAGLDGGELQYAGYLLHGRAINKFYRAMPLPDLLKRLNLFLKFANSTQNQVTADTLLGIELATMQLLGEEAFAERSEAKLPTEAEYLDRCQRHQSGFALCTYRILQSQIALLDDRPRDALEAAEIALDLLEFIPGYVHLAEHSFYYSLAMTALWDEFDEWQRDRYRQVLQRNQGQMQIWASHCPENFQHKYLLVEAERSRLDGASLATIDLYDRAIEAAWDNDFVQNAALGCELAARFWLKLEKEDFAQLYLKKARYYYQIWGAAAKVAALDREYLGLLLPTTGKGTTTTTASVGSNSDRSQSFDLASLMKATQAIVSEIVLDKFLATLLRIAIENAGASKGCLLLPREQESSPSQADSRQPSDTTSFAIEAEASIDDEEVMVLQAKPLNGHVPLSVIRYVDRTGSDAIVNHTHQDHRFSNDSYITYRDVKSLLAMPILHSGKLIGILYLENTLIADAFTPSRIELLRVLSAQAAIALDNALIYASLERKVSDRTRELQQKNISLEQTLNKLRRTQAQLIQTEKMSSLGQLVAGVAHEINNPIGFIYSNLHPAQEYVRDLLDLIATYEREYPQPTDAIVDKREEIDLDFIAEDIQQLLDSMRIGADRIREIVVSLRNFSRLDEAEMKPVNLHDGLDSTVLILQSRFKGDSRRREIEIDRHYSDLPKVVCYASQLNQVFMNVIANSCDALEARRLDLDAEEPPTISIRTERTPAHRVVISISDNGCGMDDAVKNRLFDPFFTTKPVGKGTGLGLSISYQIVVEKHGGQLRCESTPGRGTTFSIEIPISPDGSQNSA